MIKHFYLQFLSDFLSTFYIQQFIQQFIQHNFNTICTNIFLYKLLTMCTFLPTFILHLTDCQKSLSILGCQPLVNPHSRAFLSPPNPPQTAGLICPHQQNSELGINRSPTLMYQINFLGRELEGVCQLLHKLSLGSCWMQHWEWGEGSGHGAVQEGVLR